MEFSEDQRAALAAVSDRLAAAGVRLDSGPAGPAPDGAQAGEAETLAVLGKAGSGKTALLAHVAAQLAEAGLEAVGGDWEHRRRRGRTFAVLAPTNKAASVLRARGVPATTVHRVLYVPVYEPEYEKLVKWLESPEAAPPALEGVDEAALERMRAAYAAHGSAPAALAAAGFRGSDFISGWKRREEALDVGLVDEASMLDDRLIGDLRALFGLLILFGDPAQLPPVSQTGGGMVFDALPEGRKLALSRIHRQEGDSPILDLAHALQDESVGFEDFERLVEEAAAQDDRVMLCERADADLMARAPMLCWRNATRIRLIAGFRAAHGAPPDALAPGEPLICDGVELPLKHRRKRIDLEAKGLIKGAQVIYLGPGRRRGFAKLHVAGSEAPKANAAAIIKIETPESEEPLIVSAARMGAVFVHGAACTIHKAQGSQWPEIQVFAPDLFAAARTGRTEAGVALWRRLAYVAVTRAETRLRWVTRWRMSRPTKPLGVADLA